MFGFTIRELVLVTVIVAIGVEFFLLRSSVEPLLERFGWKDFFVPLMLFILFGHKLLAIMRDVVRSFWLR